MATDTRRTHTRRIEHAYPQDLARLVQVRLRAAQGDSPTPSPLPDLLALEQVISVCYQASLLREEGRPVTFRLALADPEGFASADGPPAGLHRLVFADPRALDEHELRRLAPAADFHRSLIGSRIDADAGPQIWGVLHSGLRWLQSVRGGRELQQVIPAVLTVAVTGPGRLLVSHTTTTLAELAGGLVSGLGMDVLQASWMADVFAGIGRAESGRAHRGTIGTNLDPGFAPLLASHVLRRIAATIRGAQQGGMLIVVPQARAAEVADAHYLKLKYRFSDEEPRRRIMTLTSDIMKELAKLDGNSTGALLAGWSEYETSNAPSLAELDEALFEVAHLVADFAAVDGAVVMTDCLELLGFGAEISGNLLEVPQVAQALDLTGTERQWVRTDGVGTRHRSAYRLCQAVRDALAVVISQDGGLRFVRWHGGSVTFWDQVATGPWEV
jgi:hypothetical protein